MMGNAHGAFVVLKAVKPYFRYCVRCGVLSSCIFEGRILVK